MLKGESEKEYKTLQLNSFQDYVNYLFSETGLTKELTPLIDVITTNKTDFFRENVHFEYLVNSALPELLQKNKEQFLIKEIKVWSAGCSTGEEPYTMAIVLSEFAEKNPGFVFSIYASDISTEVLKTASAGVYDYEKIETVSEVLKKKYFLKSKSSEKKLVKVIPELQSFVKFARINLIHEKYPLPDLMDVVFCRNVLIYFDKKNSGKCNKESSGKYE